MSHSTHSAGSVRHSAEKSLPDVSPAIEAMARAGYAAKGAVYCVVGGLAVLSAFGRSGGQTTGSRGAIHALLDKPAGVVLVSILAFGLAGYALWCFIQAIFDPDHEGNDTKAIATRAWRFAKGLLHGALVIAAIGMITGRGSGGGEESNIEEWTATFFSFPMGIWIVGLAGAFVIGFGLFQVYRAWKIKLDDMLALGQIDDPKARRTAVHISRFGIAARGIVFVIMGIALIVAAARTNPDEAKGFGESLQTLARQPYGPWLLAITAIGLIAYGLYEFLRAKYRIIHPTKNG